MDAIILHIMTHTTYRWLLFFSFLLPTLYLGKLLTQPAFSPKLLPDTQSYVLSSPYRTFLYPQFLDAFMVEDSQRTAVLKRESRPFSKVVAIQKVLLILAFLTFLAACHRFLPFSHLFFCLVGFFSLRSGATALLEQVSYVQPEGLLLSWLFSIFILCLDFLNMRKNLVAYGLAVLLFCGTLLSPRLVCFYPIIFLTVFVSMNRWKSLGPIAFLICLTLLRCWTIYSKAGVFSMTPMNGFYTIGNVLLLIDDTSLENARNDKEQYFLSQALKTPDRHTEMKYNDWGIWTFATALYRETFPERFSGLVKGKDVLHMNAFYAPFFPRLILKNTFFRTVWTERAVQLLKNYFRVHWRINLWLFIAAFLSVFSLFFHPASLLHIPILLWGVHLFNVFMTVPFCGEVTRYLVNSEWLVLGSIFSLSLYLWDRCAFFLLHHFFAFKRRSMILENSEGG